MSISFASKQTSRPERNRLEFMRLLSFASITLLRKKFLTPLRTNMTLIQRLKSQTPTKRKPRVHPALPNPTPIVWRPHRSAGSPLVFDRLAVPVKISIFL